MIKKLISKQRIYYLLSFLIPILMFLLVMYLRVGEIDGNYILISDMEAQYNSLFQYLKNVLNGTESLFYSFHKGLGGEMFTTFTYYLSSPLNLLVLFFEDGQIPNCILLIILIKLGLSGLTMNIYLNHKDSNKLNINLIFSMCYALMGYTINYYFNIMWLDAVYMLPIVILGLEKLMDEKKLLLYIIALSYTIICNYYMGYMVCLFALLYFIYQMINQSKKDKQIIIIFVISSILSAGIASFILIPTIIQLPKLASTQGNISINIEYMINIFKGILQNIIVGNHNCSNTINPYGTYLYITNFCIILVIIYLLNKQVTKREKILILIILLIFLTSFLLRPLTYVWHGFSLPAYFNNREAFLLCFFLIIISKKSYGLLSNITKKEMTIILILYLLLSIMQIVFLGTSVINNILVTLLFVILYVYLIYLEKNYHKHYNKYFILVFIIIELFINLYSSFVSKTIVSYSYEQYFNNVCPIVMNAEVGYRIENTIGKNGLDGLTCNYNSASIFLSTLIKNDIEFFDNYGYYSRGKILYNGGTNTIFMDSILGVHHYYTNLQKNIFKQEETCKKIGIYNDKTETIDQEEYCLYENQYALPIGYFVNGIEFEITDNVFENQNKLFNIITNNESNILSEIKYTNNNHEYTVVNNNEDFYIYIVSENVSKENTIEIYVNDKKIDMERDASLLINNIIEILSDTAITNLKIVADDINIIDDVQIYQIDNELVFDELSKINHQRVIINSMTSNTMDGKINLEEDGYVLFTIPYDKNLSIYVDSKKIELKKAFDYLVSVKMDKGEHTITIRYSKKIYYISSLCSLIFIVITLLFVKKCKKYKKNIKK